MNSAPLERRPKRPSAWFWKGPLGCLAFSLGLGIVLSALMPYACGKVSERELEARFDRSHQGSLQIERARLGSIVGEHGFWGVALFEPNGRLILNGNLLFPSVAALVRAEEGHSPVNLQLEQIVLREVHSEAGDLTNNLQYAFAPRGMDSDFDSDRDPASDEERMAIEEEEQASRFLFDGDGEEREGSVRFNLGDDNVGTVDFPRIEVEGALDLMTWSDLTDQRLLIFRAGELSGSIDNPEEQAVASFELSGNLALPQDLLKTGRLRVHGTYRFSDLSELVAWPNELSVDLDSESEALIETLDQALATLTQNRIQRQGQQATWKLKRED